MSKHTPGPWKANFAISGTVYIFGGDRNFARVFNEWQDDKNQEANARLIAAAPELFKALRELYAQVRGEASWLLDDTRGGSDRVAMMCEDAIAKATGSKW